MPSADSNSHGAAPPGLTQTDVDRLLVQMSEEPTPSGKAAFALGKNPGSAPIQHFDFRQPVFLATNELRKLRVHHENFIRSLASRLSVYLRLDCSMQLCGLTTLGFQKFVDSLPTPAHLTLFRVNPLQGVCIVEMPPRFGLPLVDRLLGGTGQVVDTDRDLSEIEIALLDQVIQIIITEWCSHWLGFQDLRPTIAGHESDGRFVPSMGQDVMMLAITIDATIRECTDQIRLAFPYYTIEPLVRKITVQLDTTTPAPATAQNTPPKWNPKLDDVQVTLSAQWRGVELTARRLAEMKVGDVIEMKPDGTPAELLCLDQVPKYRGRLGTCGSRWAVELLTPMKT